MEQIVHLESMLAEHVQQILYTTVKQTIEVGENQVSFIISGGEGQTDAYTARATQIIAESKLLTAVTLSNPSPGRMLIEGKIHFPDTYEECETTIQKALWWKKHGQRGASSLFIWNCFMGMKEGVSIPHDVGDFSRCYELLECVPEWKRSMYMLQLASPLWKGLVENWEALTKAYKDCQSNPNNSQYQEIFHLRLELSKK